ncbi:uroporphyrinogen-III C-methyltransferase [Shewanella sp. OMA3-2]|uniref:uroporphyrinogen-III C-methyltransferase n=1 Tax=Shewanella sp. OMA3-2 TaxID=2908650 RepID=UPI001F3CEDE8|nr:uroporphyrinogen-III C-methyltransferase [Shewanella sp. OMA3-2]UJF22614.1 uroporphyrinogen-III C-methyltransferase [Shewanella sp. OMA3-2]
MENNKLESTDVDTHDLVSKPQAKGDSPQAAKAASPALKRQPGPSSRHRKLRSSWWIRLSIFISWLAAGTAIAGCYWLYLQLNSQQDQQQELAVELTVLETNNQKLKQELLQSLSGPSQRIAQLEQQQTNDAKAYQQLAVLQQAQKQLQERVAVVAQRSPNHWMASEADYLVRMASRKLWLEKDPQTAASLLQSADNRIEAMKDPALHQLRKAIALDIAATRSIKATDVAGSVYAIDAVIDQVANLPLNQADTDLTVDQLAEPLSDSIDDWQTNLSKSFKQFIAGFITIRERTTDLEPLLPLEQQWYLVENVRLKLLQAQFSLHNYDQQGYHSAIDYAHRWVKQYFDNKDRRTQNTLAELEELSQLSIESVNAYQFKSTPLLQQLMTYGKMMPEEEPAL